MILNFNRGIDWFWKIKVFYVYVCVKYSNFLFIFWMVKVYL